MIRLSRLGHEMSKAGAASSDDRVVARLSDNSERLYESDNCVFGRPHRSATAGQSGGSETEMTSRRIVPLSWMYKNSSDPGDFSTASRQSARARVARVRDECDRANLGGACSRVGESMSVTNPTQSRTWPEAVVDVLI